MRHDWVFEVLRDLRRYADKNGLPALAAKVDTALAVAEAEIADVSEKQSPALQDQPSTGRQH